MALFSSSRPGIRGRVVPKFPARVQGTNGLSVVKANGVYTIQPSFEDVADVPIIDVGDADNFSLLMHDIDADTYRRVSLNVLFTSIASGFDPTLQSIAALTPTADQGIYFSGTDTAAVYSLTALGRAIAGLTSLNNSVLIGTGTFTTTPTIAGLTINNNAGALPAAPTGAVLQLGTTNGVITAQILNSFGDYNSIIGRRANGTLASPTALIVDNPIVSIRARGYKATSYSADARGAINIHSAGTWTDTSTPTYITFYTTPVGSETLTERMRVNPDGTMRFWAYTAGFLTTDGSGNITAIGAQIAPAGRLSLTAGLWNTTADVTGATSVFYVFGGAGNYVPIWDGTAFALFACAELSVPLDNDAGHTGYHQAARNFDFYAFDDAGTRRLGSSPSWNAGAVAGSDKARGTGAGSTEHEYKFGIPTNKNSIVLRFGTASGNTVSVPANRATFLGTVRMSANGQADDSFLKRFVSNAFNQLEKPMVVTDPAGSWTNTNSGIYRQANANAANKVSFVQGLDGGLFRAQAFLSFSTNTNGTGSFAGIGLDSTTVNSANIVGLTVTVNANSNVQTVSTFSGWPGLGFTDMNWLEYVQGASTQTVSGQKASGLECRGPF